MLSQMHSWFSQYNFLLQKVLEIECDCQVCFLEVSISLKKEDIDLRGRHNSMSVS